VSARGFAPGPLLTLVALVLALLFVRLGLWQWQRGVHRGQEWQGFARGAATRLELGSRDPDALPLYQRVTVSGRLDGAHQFLLDNRSQRGVAGYEVLTPLTRAGGTPLLVDRGLVPFGASRARLPDVALDAPEVAALSGRLAPLPVAGLASGRAPPDAGAPWPKVTSFPAATDLARALGVALPARMLLLDPDAPHGYLRDWQPPGIAPLRHYSYAIQWWVFAGATVIGWLLYGLRRGRPR
jgi:surfeit locus 1 family protein